jgi:uncharacterized metal-binding protein YceD (DUF177 family)
MNQSREFDIAFVGLKQGTHVFEYKVDNKFFIAYGEQDFTHCEATIKLSLEKNNGFMLLKFDIDGEAEVICDRCGNNMTKQLWDEFNIIVKMVENPDVMNEKEEDPDIYYISRGESHLHVADWLFEFVNLSIPLQKICDENESGESKCNKEVLAQLKQMEENVAKEIISPMMKGLEKFKDFDN